MADLGTLLKQAAPHAPVAPFEPEDLWKSGRRRRRALQATRAAGALTVFAIVAVGVGNLASGPSAPEVLGVDGGPAGAVDSSGDPHDGFTWETLADQNVTSVEVTSAGERWATLVLDDRLAAALQGMNGSVRGKLAVAPSGDVAVALNDRVLVFDRESKQPRTVPLTTGQPVALALDDDGTVWSMLDDSGGQRIERIGRDGSTVSRPVTQEGFDQPSLQFSGNDLHLVTSAGTEEARHVLVATDGTFDGRRGAEAVVGVPGEWLAAVAHLADPGGILGIGASNRWAVRLSQGDGSVGLDLGIGNRTDSGVTSLGLSPEGTWLGGLTVAGTSCPMWLVSLGNGAALPAATCATDTTLEAATRGFAPYAVSPMGDVWWVTVTKDDDGSSRLNILTIGVPTA